MLAEVAGLGINGDEAGVAHPGTGGPASGGRDHGGRDVDADHAPVRHHTRRQLDRSRARSAPDVEDDLTTFDTQCVHGRNSVAVGERAERIGRVAPRRLRRPSQKSRSSRSLTDTS